MGMATTYVCDRCGTESTNENDFNMISTFTETEKYFDKTVPDVYLCDKCTDEFIFNHGLELSEGHHYKRVEELPTPPDIPVVEPAIGQSSQN